MWHAQYTVWGEQEWLLAWILISNSKTDYNTKCIIVIKNETSQSWMSLRYQNNIISKTALTIQFVCKIFRGNKWKFQSDDILIQVT